MAHIQRRQRGPNGSVTWRARYRDAEGRERSKSFARRADAEAWVAGQLAALARGLWISPEAGQRTFLDFADEWAAAQDWKAASRTSWASVRARLAPTIGDMPLGAIDRLTLQRVQRDLVPRYSRSTLTLTMAYAKMVLRAAYANGSIGRDPTVGLRNPRVRADDRDAMVSPEQVPTREEATRILGAAPPRYQAAVALGMSGLRLGEVLGLCWDRVDLDAGCITIDHQLQRLAGPAVLTTPKAERNRTIDIAPFVVDELRGHRRMQLAHGERVSYGEACPVCGTDDHVLVFSGPRGTRPRRDLFYKQWRRALVGAGFTEDRFVFHSLRHFCASAMLAGGVRDQMVAAYLGHTVPTLVRVYAHWLRDDRGDMSAILARVLAPTER